jgi:hypothetical protein
MIESAGGNLDQNFKISFCFYSLSFIPRCEEVILGTYLDQSVIYQLVKESPKKSMYWEKVIIKILKVVSSWLYFWNSLSNVNFDAESESEVRFVIRARDTKPQTNLKVKTSQNVRLYEHTWMNIMFPQIVQHNPISNSCKITFSKHY